VDLNFLKNCTTLSAIVKTQRHAKQSPKPKRLRNISNNHGRASTQCPKQVQNEDCFLRYPAIDIRPSFKYAGRAVVDAGKKKKAEPRRKRKIRQCVRTMVLVVRSLVSNTRKCGNARDTSIPLPIASMPVVLPSALAKKAKRTSTEARRSLPAASTPPRHRRRRTHPRRPAQHSIPESAKSPLVLLGPGNRCAGSLIDQVPYELRVPLRQIANNPL
jgi:hypothetical protein